MEPEPLKPLKPERASDDPLLVTNLLRASAHAATPREGVLLVMRAVEQHDMHMFAQLLRELRREIVGVLTPAEED